MLIPSIDLINGKAVQLKQGKEKVLEREDVLALAKEFCKYGEIAVIDLDAALGKGNNIELVKKICKIADCRVGGGIRTIEKANELLGAGAKKIIIGTMATPEFLSQLPKARVIAAIDTKNKFVVSKGWTNSTSQTPQQLIKSLENYCSEFLFTNVDKEGMLSGLDFEAVKELKAITKNKITVAGGITTINDIKAIENLGFNSQIGMALYTKKINLADAFISLLNFEKCNSLIPTIVQDENKQVLMLGFSSKESLEKTFKTSKATYYSRSRASLWTKGETSGNFQEFIKARYDCDKDALLFTVKQKNAACHLGSYSCFGDNEFALDELSSVICSRIKNPEKNSYTSKIAEDENVIKKKILEEAEEITNYTSDSNLIWEISDLTYFILILMAKKGISISDIKNELWRRRK
ncbi:MAG: bifunctional phosphoribosyl-AMP cyclohydrolase/phosphoribosyl-ATP diphosphatase HisIE [Candidatus Micrarchaeota archaeon]